ncbi:hypothetical protein KCU61_g8767, partial [Aureobasidium melanogenum]
MAISYKTLILLILRAIQTLLSLTTLGLYATALAKHPEAPSSCIYAIICSTTTLLTLTIYSLPKFPTIKFFLWDFVLAVLWAALGGVFGMIYLSDSEKEDERIQDIETRMRAAVACDLVVMVCWVVTAGWGCLGFCKAALAARRTRKEQKEAEKMFDGQERGIVEMEQESDGDYEKRLMGEKMQGKCVKS